ncbi:MAG: flagellar basal body rod protein FlgB [Ruminiclostridium sp.]|nr:flagellar basal body rod protein FlgB [Ruminiclostridium sp.]
MALFDTTSFRVAAQGLELLTKQQAIIAQNIANQDTPDYKCKYLYFSAVLRDKLKESAKSVKNNYGNSQKFSTGFVGFEREADEKPYELTAPTIEGKRLELASVIHVDETTADQPDGNNVDADTQEALFAKNALQYEALINQINSEFTMMRTAMRKQ